MCDAERVDENAFGERPTVHRFVPAFYMNVRPKRIPRISRLHDALSTSNTHTERHQIHTVAVQHHPILSRGFVANHDSPSTARRLGAVERTDPSAIHDHTIDWRRNRRVLWNRNVARIRRRTVIAPLASFRHRVPRRRKHYFTTQTRKTPATAPPNASAIHFIVLRIRSLCADARSAAMRRRSAIAAADSASMSSSLSYPGKPIRSPAAPIPSAVPSTNDQ